MFFEQQCVCRLTEVSVDQFAVVHLPSHGSDLLQLCFLSLNSLLQPLQLLSLRLENDKQTPQSLY